MQLILSHKIVMGCFLKGDIYYTQLYIHCIYLYSILTVIFMFAVSFFLFTVVAEL